MSVLYHSLIGQADNIVIVFSFFSKVLVIIFFCMCDDFLLQDVQKSKQFLPFLTRAGKTEALVEFVASGSRMRLYIPKETCLVTVLLSGLLSTLCNTFDRLANQSSRNLFFGVYYCKIFLKNDLHVVQDIVEDLGVR